MCKCDLVPFSYYTWYNPNSVYIPWWPERVDFFFTKFRPTYLQIWNYANYLRIVAQANAGLGFTLGSSLLISNLNISESSSPDPKILFSWVIWTIYITAQTGEVAILSNGYNWQQKYIMEVDSRWAGLSWIKYLDSFSNWQYTISVHQRQPPL